MARQEGDCHICYIMLYPHLRFLCPIFRWVKSVPEAQTFSFLYSQQEAIYLALYSEVSEAKALSGGASTWPGGFETSMSVVP